MVHSFHSHVLKRVKILCVIDIGKSYLLFGSWGIALTVQIGSEPVSYLRIWLFRYPRELSWMAAASEAKLVQNIQRVISSEGGWWILHWLEYATPEEFVVLMLNPSDQEIAVFPLLELFLEIAGVSKFLWAPHTFKVCWLQLAHAHSPIVDDRLIIVY